jgi:hypothetical protein
MGNGKIVRFTDLKEINYSIVLSIMKGMNYSGVVNI